jgi:hypothetical protein
MVGQVLQMEIRIGKKNMVCFARDLIYHADHAAGQVQLIDAQQHARFVADLFSNLSGYGCTLFFCAGSAGRMCKLRMLSA